MGEKEIPCAPGLRQACCLQGRDTQLERRRGVSEAAGGFPNSHSFYVKITVGLLEVYVNAQCWASELS